MSTLLFSSVVGLGKIPWPCWIHGSLGFWGPWGGGKAPSLARLVNPQGATHIGAFSITQIKHLAGVGSSLGLKQGSIHSYIVACFRQFRQPGRDLCALTSNFSLALTNSSDSSGLGGITVAGLGGLTVAGLEGF